MEATSFLISVLVLFVLYKLRDGARFKVYIRSQRKAHKRRQISRPSSRSKAKKLHKLRASFSSGRFSDSCDEQESQERQERQEHVEHSAEAHSSEEIAESLFPATVCPESDVGGHFYPDGDISRLNVSFRTRDIGWSLRSWTNGVSQKKGTERKSYKCLGVYQCTNSECPGVFGPRKKGLIRNVPASKACKERTIAEGCHRCGQPWKIFNCEAKCLFIDHEDGSVEFKHVGNHLHPRPIPKRISQFGLAALKDSIKSNPYMKNKTRMIQSKLVLLDQTLNNYDAAAYQTRVAKKELRAGTAAAALKTEGNLFSSLSAFQSEHPNFIIKADLVAGQECVVMRSLWQANFMAQRLFTLILSDVTYGIVKGFYWCSSLAWHEDLQRHVPILATVLKGTTSDYYQIHFEQLLNDLDLIYPVQNHNFVADFSLAQKNGFKRAFANWASRKTGISIEDETNLSNFMEEAVNLLIGCSVHFRNSVDKIKHNGSVIPFDEQNHFEQLVQILLKETTSQDLFDQTIVEIERTFPKTTHWLKFWLQPDISKMIFRKTPSIRRISLNPLEGSHRDYKAHAPKNAAPPAAIYEWHKYVSAIGSELDFVDLGGQTRYGQRKKFNKSKKAKKIARKTSKKHDAFAESVYKAPVRTDQLIISDKTKMVNDYEFENNEAEIFWLENERDWKRFEEEDSSKKTTIQELPSKGQDLVIAEALLDLEHEEQRKFVDLTTSEALAKSQNPVKAHKVLQFIVHDESLNDLLKPVYLNNEIIDSFLQLVVGRYFLLMETAFTSILMKPNHEVVSWIETLLKNEDFKAVAFPINIGNYHWICAIYHRKSKRLVIYDPLRRDYITDLGNFIASLEKYIQVDSVEMDDFDVWQQPGDTVNCGAYCCYYIFIAFGSARDPEFDPAIFRVFMSIMILQHAVKYEY